MDGSQPSPTYRSLAQLHRLQAERLGPRPALRYRRQGVYHDLTWTDYREQALAGAAALIEAGVQPGDRVGLVAENRVEWLVADMAILTAGAATVSPHAPLTAHQIHYQLEDAGVVWVIVSTPAQLEKVLEVRGHLPRVRGIVFMEGCWGGEILSWAGFLQRGRQALAGLGKEIRKREEGLGPDDVATIMYTSGTTGNPKGVVLTHGNLLSNAEACLRLSPHQPGDVVLSWLPYTHIYARTIDHYKGLLSGVCTCLGESADTLVESVKEVQPTHMASVPRFYEKVLSAVTAKDPEETGRRLRHIFGPRVDWLSSGGAPLPLPVAEAYRRAGLLVLQGYGLTESSPVITFNRKDAYRLHTVGLPLPGVEVKIAPDGEILTRGPHVMKGYWKQPEATAEAIRDGWLHTGDLGQLDADGFLSITGRKKELLVLSSGKKVVPSYLEGLLITDPCIDQAVVCGEGHSFLTALVVPHWDNVRLVLEERGVSLAEDPEERAGCPQVYALLQERARAALADVAPYEQVKKLVVLPQAFSIASEELTVSLKLRRGVVLARHAEQISRLYAEEARPAGAGS